MEQNPSTNNNSSGSKVPRSDTAATAAAFDVEQNPYLIGHEPATLGVGFPGLPGVPRGARVASQEVYDAFRASQSLQGAAVMDCLISGVTALTGIGVWGLLFILLIPFGLVGRHEASRYHTGKLLQMYLVYLVITLLIHSFIAVLLFIYSYPFDGVLQVLKTGIYGWFIFLTLKFRKAVRPIAREEREKLRSGRFTIARFEHLVFI